MLALAAAITLGPRSLPPLGGAAVGLALALFLALRPSAPTRVWFALVALSSAVWSLCVAVELSAVSAAVAAVAARIAYSAIPFAGTTALSFGRSLARTRERWERPAHAAAAAVALLVWCVPSLTPLAPRPGGGYWPLPSPLLPLVVLVALPPLLRGLYIVRRAIRDLPPCRHRRQLAWAWTAILLGAGGALDAHTLFTRGYPTAWLTSALASMTMFYAVAQHRLMAPRTFVRQALTGMIGALAGGALVAALVTVTPALFASTGAALGATSLALFVAVRLWITPIEPALRRLLGWRSRRIDRALVDFERRSLDARSAADVTLLCAEALADAFDARLMRTLPADRSRDGEDDSLAVAEAVLAESGAPLLRDLVDLDDPRAPRLLAALDQLAADALVPLVRDKQLLATMAVAGEALTPADDLVADELRRVGRRAAVAWVNARLYDEVARRSAGLEAQVRLRTAALEEALGELRAAHGRLLEVERSSSLGLLVAGISHEINNALNIIHANLGTLASYAARYGALAGDPTGDVALARAEWPRAIAELSDSVKRTRAIVDDLRRFARPDAERRLVRVQEGLDAALNLLRRRTDGRLDVTRIYSGTPSVDGYPGQLNQCFFNLLLNAVEAAHSAIWVVLGPRDAEGGVALTISDDGDGIDDDDKERLFLPFFTTKPRAAGLGLTVSRSVVQRHGGTLDVESSPDGGASVRLTLPASAPAPAPAAPPAPGEAP